MGAHSRDTLPEVCVGDTLTGTLLDFSGSPVRKDGRRGEMGRRGNTQSKKTGARKDTSVVLTRTGYMHIIRTH